MTDPKIQNKPKIYSLRERLLNFSKRILRICKTLPNDPECYVIRKQLARSAMSIGANFEEADGALTKKDFINKSGIARKEAKETKYWLRIIEGSWIPNQQIFSEICETEEIINILSAILKNSATR